MGAEATLGRAVLVLTTDDTQLGKGLDKASKDVQSELKKLGADWKDFVKGFDVGDAIANPLQTGKSAALGLAGSIEGVGVVAAAAVAGVFALGGAVFSLAANAAAVGAGLDDMADKTGLSVPALSRLSSAAQVIGADMGTLTDIIFKLEKGIGDNSEEFRKGLEKMGLSTQQLKAVGPDHYLDLITEGLNSIPDASDRAAAGAAVLGKGYKDVAATLQDVGEALRLTADITPWSAEQAADAEAFEMQMKSIWVHAAALATGLGRELIPAVSAVVGWLKDAGGWLLTTAGNMSGFLPFVERFAEAWRFSAAALAYFRGEAEKLPKPAGDATRGVDAWKKSVGELALKVPSLTQALENENVAGKALTETAKASIAANQKAKKADEDWKKVLVELNSVGGNWQETLEGIDGEVVEAVKYYLKAGVAQDKLATAYDLTASQIKAVSSALEEEKAWLTEVEREHEVTTGLAIQHEKTWREEQARLLKKSNDDTAQSLIETGRLWDEYYDEIDRETLSTTDYQLKQVDRWFDGEVDKLRDDDAAWGLHYNALYAKAEQNKQKILALNDPFKRAQKAAQDELKADWDHFLDDVAGGFTKTFSEDIVDVLFGDGGFHDVWKNLWEMFKEDVKAILADILNNVIEGFVQGAAKKFGGFLAGLMGGSSGGGSGGAGWLGWLLGLFGGGNGGGTGSTPITNGYFNGDGVWVPVPAGGGDPGQGQAPTDPNPGQHESTGGIIAKYLARGGFPGEPRGTDIAPVWMTPGEGVLNVDATNALGRSRLDFLNAGGAVESLGQSITMHNVFTVNGDGQARDIVTQIEDSFDRVIAPRLLEKLRTDGAYRRDAQQRLGVR